MTHLAPDEVIDAMENRLAAERQRHLDACPECQRQLEGLADVVIEARQTSVPEPSPLFWQHLSSNVNAEIDKQIASAWPSWLRWQTLLPLGAVAILILALMISVPKSDHAEVLPEPTAVADSQPDADHWVAVAELVGEFDLDAAAETGVIEPGLAEQAVLELTADERAELTRLLQAELRVKS